MAQRTQIRLEQVTGSLSQDVAANGTLNASSLKDVLNAMASGLHNITGQDFFNVSDSVLKDQSGNSRIVYVKDAGLKIKSEDGSTDALIIGSTGGDPAASFAGSLSVSGVSSLAAITGSAGLQLAGDLEVGAAAVLKSSLELTGNADLNGQLDVAGAVALAASGVRSTFRGSLQVDQAANIDGTLDVTSAATLDSTLDVSGAATLSSTLDVTGAVTLSDSLGVSGNATLSADLSAAGSISFSSTAGTSAASDPDVSISGYANIAKDVKLQAALEVGGAADLKSTLDVAGNSDLKGTLAVAENATFAKDISAVSGSFSGDLSISGNLTVNGTTTTLDTTNLLVEDPLIVLAKNQNGTALDQGIIFQRDGSNNYAMIWDESADQFVFANVNNESGTTSGDVTIADYAPLRIGALTADDAASVGGILSVTGAITGSAGLAMTGDSSFQNAVTITGNATLSSALSVAGTSSLASTKISTLISGRMLLAGTNGLVVDNDAGKAVTFNGTTLSVGNDFSVTHSSGATSAGVTTVSKLQVDSSSDYLDVVSSDLTAVASAGFTVDAAGDITLDADGGDIVLKDGGTLFGGLSLDGAKGLVLSSSSGKNIAFKSGNNLHNFFSSNDANQPFAIDMSDVGTGYKLQSGGSTKIILNDGGNHTLSGSSWGFKSGTGAVEARLYDNDLSHYVALKSSNLTSNVTFQLPASNGTNGYALVTDGSGATSWSDLSVSSNTKKAIKVMTASVGANSAISFASGQVESDSDAYAASGGVSLLSFLGKQHQVDVFVNGQMMTTGSSAQISGATRDYRITSETEINFSFGLEIDDVIQVITRG